MLWKINSGNLMNYFSVCSKYVERIIIKKKKNSCAYGLSRRSVKGHLKTNQVTPSTMPISNALLTHVRSANARYKLYLNSEQESAKRREMDELSKQIKEKELQINNLNNSCVALEKDRERCAKAVEVAVVAGDEKKATQMVLQQAGIKRKLSKIESEQKEIEDIIDSLKAKRNRKD